MDETSPPPKVYRAMRRDPQDGLPVVEAGSAGLGVRPAYDVHLDEAGHVRLDGGGMSVAPEWRKLPPTLIPRRLSDLAPEAAGGNNRSCFRLGTGPFVRSVVAEGLELLPDEGGVAASHGVLAPLRSVPLAAYESDLAATRASWIVDEA